MADMLRPAELARELHLSPVRVRQLAVQGRIPFIVTPGGHRRFDLAEVRAALARTDTILWQASHALESAAEDEVWREMQPHLGQLTKQARAIAAYSVTEMVNNAIDHSEGSQVTVDVRHDRGEIVITVRDDGIGVFQKVQSAFDLPDEFAAVAELSKGKRTTAPDKHSGEGIFFTSKAVDVFELSANGITWVVDNAASDQSVGISGIGIGTQVRLRIGAESTRELGAVFRAFSEDHDFARSQPVIRLFEIGTEFVSRSEAKRLLSGMEAFSEITLDFEGVVSVGQGFVDEVFRVWALEHPTVKLSPKNANPAVTFMIERGLPR